jgi:hypothetical protein
VRTASEAASGFADDIAFDLAEEKMAVCQILIRCFMIIV